VSAIADVDPERARQALELSGLSVRDAIDSLVREG